MSRIDLKRIAGFAEQLKSAGDPFAKFSNFLNAFGVKGFSYGFAVLRSEMTRPDRTKSVFFTHSYPSQWEQEIASGPFLDFDPAIDLLLQNTTIYEWTQPNEKDLLKNLPKGPRQQIEIERDMGMNYGVTIPLNLGGQGVSMMGLWFENQSSVDKFRREWAEHGPSLMQAGNLLDLHVRKDDPNLLVGLSPREIEALTLLLAGHRATEICWKMDISEKTLEKHMLHARTKLKATTRDQALAKAILLGLVDV